MEKEKKNKRDKSNILSTTALEFIKNTSNDKRIGIIPHCYALKKLPQATDISLIFYFLMFPRDSTVLFDYNPSIYCNLLN